MTDQPSEVGLSVNNICVAGNHVFLLGQQFCQCGKARLMPKCIWTESFDIQTTHEYFWYTTCGTHYYDNPSDNGFFFCPNCGKKIEAIPMRIK